MTVNPGTLGRETTMMRVVKDTEQQKDIVVEQDEFGTVHTYSVIEIVGIVEHINSSLADDPDLKRGDLPFAHVPVNPFNNEIFNAVRDGILLAKFMNTIRDEPVLTKQTIKPSMTVFQMNENNIRIVKAAKIFTAGSGSAVGAAQLSEGKPAYLILGLLWQLVAFDLKRKVKCMLANRDTSILVKDEEQKEVLENLMPEEILLRWFNYHLRKAGHPEEITNFGTDIKDSTKYLILLHQLEPGKCNLDSLKEQNMLRRACGVLVQADKIGCRKFISANAILEGIEQINFAFVAFLFSKYPSMEKKETFSKPPEPEPTPEPQKPEPEPEPVQPVEPEIPDTPESPEIARITEPQEDLDKKLHDFSRNALRTKEELKRAIVETEKTKAKDTIEAEHRIARLEEEKTKMEQQHEEEKAELTKKLAKLTEKNSKITVMANLTPEQIKQNIQKKIEERTELLKQNDELFKQRADAISELHSIQQETVQAQEKVAEETRKLTKTQLHAERRIDRLKQEIEDVGLDKLENEIQEEQEVIDDIKVDTAHLVVEKDHLTTELQERKHDTKQLHSIIEEMQQQLQSITSEYDQARKEKKDTDNKIKHVTRKTHRVQEETKQIKRDTDDLKKETLALEDEHENLVEEDEELLHKRTLADTTREMLDENVEERYDALVTAKEEHETEVQLATHKARAEIDALVARHGMEKKRLLLKRQQLNEEIAGLESDLAVEQIDTHEAQREQNSLTIDMFEKKAALLEAKRMRELADHDLAELEDQMAETAAEQEITEHKAHELDKKKQIVHKQLANARLEQDKAESEARQAESTVKQKELEKEVITENAEEVKRSLTRLTLAKRELEGDLSEMAKKSEEQEEEARLKLEAITAAGKAAIEKELKAHKKRKDKRIKEKQSLDNQVTELTESLMSAKNAVEEELNRKSAAENRSSKLETELAAAESQTAQLRESSKSLEQSLKEAMQMLDFSASSIAEEEERAKRLRRKARKAEKEAAAAKALADTAALNAKKADALEQQLLSAVEQKDAILTNARIEAEKIKQQTEIDLENTRKKRAKENETKRKLQAAQTTTELKKLETQLKSSVSTEAKRTSHLLAEKDELDRRLAELQMENYRLERSNLREDAKRADARTDAALKPSRP